MQKVVIDTNIFVSGLLDSKSSSNFIIELFLQNKFTLLITHPVLRELREILTRKPLSRLANRPVDEFLTLLERQAKKVSPGEKVRIIKDDPEDNKFLECALAGKADFIISGDHHLLSLRKFRGISILNSKEALKRLKASAN